MNYHNIKPSNISRVIFFLWIIILICFSIFALNQESTIIFYIMYFLGSVLFFYLFFLILKIEKSSKENKIETKQKKPEILQNFFYTKNKKNTEKIENSTTLKKHQKYLQIALNTTPQNAKEIIQYLPQSEKILIEAGTPLIKNYGINVISQIKNWYLENFFKKELVIKEPSYIIADLKCADLAEREVVMAKNAGASAITCLGNAPIATIDKFIDSCQKFNVDSMIDMMNVENPILILKSLKKLPDVVILHRGVDETQKNKEKQIPYYQIKQIKSFSNKILVSIAGGDKIEEIKHSIFNDVDIVILWEEFYYPSPEITNLTNSFLKEIR